MAKLMRKQLLLAAIQSGQGNDSSPSHTANAILCGNIQPEPIAAEYVERTNIRPYFGNNPRLAAGIHRAISFEVEIAGAGTPGLAPAWDPLIRACGFAGSTNPGSPGEYHYTPISDGLPYLTLYYWIDGIRMKLVDAVGSVSFDFTSKQIPRFSFRFISEYEAMEDVSTPTGPVYSAFVDPVTVGKVWTPSFQLHGVTACMQSLNVDLAANAIYRDLVGCGGPLITDRKPTGTAVFELTSVATKGWDEVVKNSTQSPLYFTHGRTAGNIVRLEMPSVACDNFSLQDQDGIAMVSMGLTINPGPLGNDEIVIVVS